LSWGTKFYLDAHILRVSVHANNKAGLPDRIVKNDGLLKVFRAIINTGDRVLETGYGRGCFLQHLKQAVPDITCVSVGSCADSSDDNASGIKHVEGRPERVPLPDATFDLAFSTEALESSPNPYAVASELVRMAEPVGWIVIVERRGSVLSRPSGGHELTFLLNRYCDEVSAEPVACGDSDRLDGLMVVWKGSVDQLINGQFVTMRQYDTVTTWTSTPHRDFVYLQKGAENAMKAGSEGAEVLAL
jgi:hypothetical protein